MEFIRANRDRRGEWIEESATCLRDGRQVTIAIDIDSFASEQWKKTLRDKRRPGLLARRHLEVCVLSCLAAELRSGDIAVGRLGLLRQPARRAHELVDAGYPANTDLRLEGDKPVLARRKGAERRPSALTLEARILDRLPERGLLDILARTAHLTGWHRHFGPRSGSDPKISDTMGRYVVTAFAYGSQIDTWENNLLAESHIRYGGFGGLAYRLISDTYVALFSRFIPCGVWEAVYLLDLLLSNDSAIQPGSVHADTQGQSLPVFGLAALLGFELLPRIRNWHDLNFYRPSPQARYKHIDSLFGADAIDWDRLEKHWPDLLRTGISIREGRLSSVTLLRRLGNHSRRNRLYEALRELGRVVRTVTLLRYLSEPVTRLDLQPRVLFPTSTA